MPGNHAPSIMGGEIKWSNRSFLISITCCSFVGTEEGVGEGGVINAITIIAKL